MIYSLMQTPLFILTNLYIINKMYTFLIEKTLMLTLQKALL